ncbi:major intrinsic protein domain-containing protein [Phthorimaea operculella]|nr:major intrinsic protein domain-containing protein [Phthorimaea operculella]
MAGEAEEHFLEIAEHKVDPSRRKSSVASADWLCGGEDAGATWRAVAAELVGSALLVLFCCLPAALGASPTHCGLTTGAVVAMLVQCLDHLSYAMFNPAVTLVGVVMGRITWRRGLLYTPAQLVGATLGARLLVHVASGLSAGVCTSCLTLPAAGVDGYRAMVIEAALTAGLALANCAAWDPRNKAYGESWPLRIGATVAALALSAGGATGASMNPARSFGPALCAGNWQHQWVYWVGPLGGALLASLLYRALWSPPPSSAQLT